MRGGRRRRRRQQAGGAHALAQIPNKIDIAARVWQVEDVKQKRCKIYVVEEQVVFYRFMLCVCCASQRTYACELVREHI